MTIKRLKELNRNKLILQATIFASGGTLYHLIPALKELMEVVMQERFKILERCRKNEKLFRQVMNIEV